jgi:hypothetical protein
VYGERGVKTGMYRVKKSAGFAAKAVGTINKNNFTFESEV